jgi:hypothetical protein
MDTTQKSGMDRGYDTFSNYKTIMENNLMETM